MQEDIFMKYDIFMKNIYARFGCSRSRYKKFQNAYFDLKRQKMEEIHGF